MARGDDLHAIKYLPLKLKGRARHWLNRLPADFVGSWEDLEDAFLDNFQGTYVRPPDADDLSHITQQPVESAGQFWTKGPVEVLAQALERMPVLDERTPLPERKDN